MNGQANRTVRRLVVGQEGFRLKSTPNSKTNTAGKRSQYQQPGKLEQQAEAANNGGCLHANYNGAHTDSEMFARIPVRHVTR